MGRVEIYFPNVYVLIDNTLKYPKCVNFMVFNLFEAIYVIEGYGGYYG